MPLTIHPCLLALPVQRPQLSQYNKSVGQSGCQYCLVVFNLQVCAVMLGPDAKVPAYKSDLLPIAEAPGCALYSFASPLSPDNLSSLSNH